MHILKTIFAVAAVSSLSLIGVDAREAGGAKSAAHFSAGGGGTAHHFGSARSRTNHRHANAKNRTHDRVRNASHRNSNGKAKGNTNDRGRDSEETNAPANPDPVEVELPQRDDGDAGDRDTGNILMGGIGSAPDNEDRQGGGG